MSNAPGSTPAPSGGTGPRTGPDHNEQAPVRYRWRLLRAGTFRLDGGSMFGLVPRVVWSRSCPPDERGRIPVQHNCLLLERVGGTGPAGPKLVLIETGTGSKLGAKDREIFDLEARSIEDALQEVDCAARDIGGVLVTHLHFDHAGGLTRPARAGEKPDWRGPGSSFGGGGGGAGGARDAQPVCLTFPGASVHVQRREWDDALASRSVMTRTYFADHLEPIRERVVLADSPRPFAPGVMPDRDASPSVPTVLRMSEPLPGVRCFLAPGHTWGQQAIGFVDERDRFVVFVPDVMPTAQHVGAAYSLAYDVEPYTSMLTRRWLLGSAADGAGGGGDDPASRAWTLVLDHEPGHPIFTARRNGQGWFELVPADQG